MFKIIEITDNDALNRYDTFNLIQKINGKLFALNATYHDFISLNKEYKEMIISLLTKEQMEEFYISLNSYINLKWPNSSSMDEVVYKEYLFGLWIKKQQKAEQDINLT
jgi:hypothetical protein